MNSIKDIQRRAFLKKMGLAGAAFGAAPLYGLGLSENGLSSNMIWVEAQSFADKGGWVVDQQFMDQMGAPYLMARGMGVPCKDATTSVKVPKRGKYRVWIRANNWNAQWSSEAAGPFMCMVDGKPLGNMFGRGAEGWLWEDGGVVSIEQHEIQLALRDLTGFNGRCDAILFSKDLDFVPPNTPEALRDLRRSALGLGDTAPLAGSYDLVVVGGGAAGVTCAISAARLGMKTALINDRPVLGGNNSEEVCIPAQAQVCVDPYPNVGLVGRDVAVNQKRSLEGWKTQRRNILSTVKQELVEAEDNLDLYPNMRLTRVAMSGDNIRSVTCQHTVNSSELRFEAPMFVDSSGDGNLGYLAGAEFRMGREARATHDESLAPEIADNLKNGTTCLWTAHKRSEASEFPLCDWAVQCDEMFSPDFNRKRYVEFPDYKTGGSWYWQNGWEKDTINQGELIRDYNHLALFGYWSFIKNKSARRDEYTHYKMTRNDYVNGKRESRRLLGDHILTQHDVENKNTYKDAFVYGTYMIDMHFGPKKSIFPHGEFLLGKHVHNKAARKPDYNYEGHNNDPYPIPFGSLYSRNIPNLMMAGRCISSTHIAHSTARIIHTTTLMGEVVAMGASLSLEHDCTPRTVRHKHVEKLRHLAEIGIPWTPKV